MATTSVSGPSQYLFDTGHGLNMEDDYYSLQ